MEYQADEKVKSEKKNKDKLPKVLNYYKDSDFTIKQKARFIYHLILTAIVGIVLLILISAYIQLNSIDYEGIFWPVIFAMCAVFIILGISLFLLIKGKIQIVAHIFMITTMTSIWFVMWIDRGNSFERLNTVVLIIALLNLAPLFITKYKSTILIYVIVNLSVLMIFIQTNKDILILSGTSILDYIIDTFIAIVFTGIAGYNIFRINKQSFEKVEFDYQKRITAEDALKQSEMFRQRVFNSSKVPIVVLNSTSFEYIDLNDAAIDIYGFNSREESLGKTPMDVSAPFQYDGTPSAQKALMYFEKALKEGSVSFEWLHQKSNGDLWDAAVHLLSFQSNGETLLQFSLIDITERKIAEKALKESEEKYRTLMESMSEVIMMVDNDDRVQYVNKKFTETLGYLPEEIIGEIGYKKLLDPKDHEVIIKENQKRTKNLINQYELSFIAKSGDKIDFLVSGSPVKDTNGKTIGSMGAMTDITERKKDQRALKESEEKYRTLMESMNEVVMMVDNQDRIQYVNKKFTEKLGFSPEEVIEEVGFKFLFDENEIDVINNASFNRSKNIVTPYELSFADKSGQKIVFLVSAAPMTNSEGKAIGFILAMADITDKKIIELELEKHRNHLEFLVKERTEELATTNEELLSTNEELHNQREELEVTLKNLQNTQNQLIQAEKMASLGVLASGVAHEINNPLNFIQGGIYGLEQYFDENLQEHKKEVAPLIEGVNVGIDRAANIVASLNHYSRQNDSKIEECDIHSIINNCLVILRNQIESKIEIEENYTSESYNLFGNDGKLHQAMLNILLNAVQSIDSKGKISISTNIADQKLEINISDNGCGISPENMSKIYDPFFTTKQAGMGTGLGLSITYNIFAEHNGSIDIESKIGKGTTVFIKLPLK